MALEPETRIEIIIAYSHEDAPPPLRAIWFLTWPLAGSRHIVLIAEADAVSP